MLVGVIFIFIILLMIVANDFQSATESVKQVTQDLEATREQVIEQAREEALSKARNELLTQELDAARAKAFEEEKARAVAQALAEYKASRAETIALNSPSIVQQRAPAQKNTTSAQDKKKAEQVRANSKAIQQKRKEVQNQFNDSRAEVVRRIQQAMKQRGLTVTAKPNQGVLIIPESTLFYGNQGELNYVGKQAISALANQFSKYLPCIASASSLNRQGACSGLSFKPNDGLDVIYIDDYPSASGSKEDTLLLAVQRVVSVFNQLKTAEPYLDTGLRNKFGVPILNVKVNQSRRNANKRRRQNAATKDSVVIRLIMRRAARSVYTQ